MRILTITKRKTSGKDLILDRFGRYYHLPLELSQKRSGSLVLAADYAGGGVEELTLGSCQIVGVPLTPARLAEYRAEVRTRAREFRPDVVIGGGDTHLGWIGERLARSLDVPFVFDVFDNYESFRSGGIPGFKRLFRSLSRRADKTVVVSEGLGELLGLSDGVCVVPNGVDMELFRPFRPEVVHDGHTIVYVGGLGVDRGVETLIRATEILREGDDDLELVVAGPLLEGYGLPTYEWLDYRGFVDQREIPSLLSGASVAVLPYPDSAWARYTSAYKLREYMACEVPVVVTDVSNYRQLAAAQEAVCRPGDHRDMARAIRFQLENRATLERDDAWSWESVAGELYHELEDLINAT